MNKKNKFKLDFYRMTHCEFTIAKFISCFFKRHDVRFLYYYRNQERNFFIKILLKKMINKYGLEIFSKNIGEGFYIGHPYGITINAGVQIGKNCNIHKGATIGQENRGKRKGTPVIGNNVWIGINSTIVGKIVIGNDVLIAPNTYVNKDIPSHSIVIGNPCKIIPNKEATKEYINYTI